MGSADDGADNCSDNRADTGTNKDADNGQC